MKHWWRFWIRVYFWTFLRVTVNGLQRLLKGEPWADRAELPVFETPQQLEKFIAENFDWSADKILGISVDFNSNPKVTYARLLKLGNEKDGDCDDVHFFAAACLRLIPGVAWAHPLSCVWKKGGHTTCLYEYKGAKHLFNYEIGPFIDAADLEEAAAIAAERVLKWKNDNLDEGEERRDKLKFWVLETTKNRLLASS